MKKWKGDLKVMAYPKILRKANKFSHMRDLFQSPKIFLNLKGL